MYTCIKGVYRMYVYVYVYILYPYMCTFIKGLFCIYTYYV